MSEPNGTKYQDIIDALNNNKEILTGRISGMPCLNFLNGVKNEDGDLSKINMNTSVDFASLSGSFIAGMGDFVNLFELKV